MQNNENLYLSSDEKVCIVALFYAKLNSNDDRYKGITNKIAKAAKTLNCNPNTLKQIKDYYDSYFENGRTGWNADLPPKYESVYNEYKNYTIDDLEELVDNILNIKL